MAPYWTDIDVSIDDGVVIINLLSASQLQNINSLISSREAISFTGTFALRTRWDNVCPYDGNGQSCTEVSSTMVSNPSNLLLSSRPTHLKLC